MEVLTALINLLNLLIHLVQVFLANPIHLFIPLLQVLLEAAVSNQLYLSLKKMAALNKFKPYCIYAQQL
jgi:hypothetical protein